MLDATRSAIVSAYADACRGYDEEYNGEVTALKGNLKAGEVYRAPNRLSGMYYERANDGILAARKKALDAIERARERVSKDLTNAPSTDAANYITSIQQRDDLTEYEVNAALERYHDHATQTAIVAAAKRSGIHANITTKTNAELATLDALEDKVNREFSTHTIGNASAGLRGIVARDFETFEYGQDPLQALKGVFNG